MKPKDLEKAKPIINQHKIFFKKLCKVKHPIPFFKKHCRSHHQTGRGIATLIAAIAPAIISLVQGLISGVALATFCSRLIKNCSMLSSRLATSYAKQTVTAHAPALQTR